MNISPQADDTVPCPYCLERIKPGALKCKHCASDLSNFQPGSQLTRPSDSAIGFRTAEPREAAPRSMPKCVRRAFRKYAVFSGRATRPEFWYFQLFLVVLGISIGIFTRNAGLQAFGDDASILVNLATLLPTLAVATRRLHDTGHSGAWILLLLTVVGAIPLIIWWARKGDTQPNKYGAAPL